MACLMGIDLGTSSVKTIVMREDGRFLASAAAGYDISIPKPGYAEHDPEMWYDKTVATIAEAVAASGVAADEIKAVSFAGHMHGLVALDAAGKPVRPAIIWPDRRTSRTVGEIYARVGRGFVAQNTQNALAAGFLVASLVWLKENEPDAYRRIATLILPKDYIKYKLSGVLATDFSDASATLAFNNLTMRWSDELIAALGLDRSMFPPCQPSTLAVGTVIPAAARDTGLSEKTVVVAGGADQGMQAVGNGIIAPGVFAAVIGTGGQVFTSVDKPVFDPQLRTATFAHVLPGMWYVMGACLASGLSLKWLAKSVLGVDDFALLDRWAAEIPAGSGGLTFLPYLAGERTPHFDPDAKGVFFGLTLGHDRRHLARAVMEGVTYSLKDCLEVLLGLGLPCRKLVASGGGANSPFWLQMQADVFEQDVQKSLAGEQASRGAAIAAGVGVSLYRGFAEACETLVRREEKVYHPRAEAVEAYRRGFETYRELYRTNRELFRRIELETP